MTHVSALSRTAAADACGLSEDVLDRAIRTGDLKAKKSGRRVLILPAELDRYVESLPDYEAAS